MSQDLFPYLIPTAIGALVAGGYLLDRWFGGGAERAIRRAPRRSIQTFPEGMPGVVRGRIVAHEGKSVRAPLSGRACVAYAVRVEEYQTEGRRGSWQAIVQDFDAVNFLVDDGTGRALVRAAGSWPSPVMDRVGGAGMFADAGPALEELLRAHGQSSRGLLFNKQLRALEGVLSAGTQVAVLGIARRGDEPLGESAGGGYRRGPTSLVIDCLDDGRLLMSNAPPALR
jgi:hypothetical protein